MKTVIFFLIFAGTWLLSNGIISIELYKNSQSWRGTRQTWAKDHSIRIIRILIALCLLVCAGYLLAQIPASTIEIQPFI